jgi:hypothetical protein
VLDADRLTQQPNRIETAKKKAAALVAARILEVIGSLLPG